MHILRVMMLIFAASTILALASNAGAEQTLSKEGKFAIELSLEPSPLEPNIPVNFTIKFKEPGSGALALIPHVDWKMVIQNQGKTVAEFSDHTMFGIVDFKSEERSFTFNDTGNFEIVIEARQTETGLSESARFTLSVVPEFPATPILLLLVIPTATVILVQRVYYRGRNIWFTEPNNAKIGNIAITEIPAE